MTRVGDSAPYRVRWGLRIATSRQGLSKFAPPSLACRADALLIATSFGQNIPAAAYDGFVLGTRSDVDLTKWSADRFSGPGERWQR